MVCPVFVIGDELVEIDVEQSVFRNDEPPAKERTINRATMREPGPLIEAYDLVGLA